MELLEFIFSSPWIFCGFLLILLIIVEGIVNIIKTIRKTNVEEINDIFNRFMAFMKAVIDADIQLEADKRYKENLEKLRNSDDNDKE